MSNLLRKNIEYVLVCLKTILIACVMTAALWWEIGSLTVLTSINIMVALCIWGFWMYKETPRLFSSAIVFAGNAFVLERFWHYLIATLLLLVLSAATARLATHESVQNRGDKWTIAPLHFFFIFPWGLIAFIVLQKEGHTSLAWAAIGAWVVTEFFLWCRIAKHKNETNVALEDFGEGGGMPTLH